MTAKLLLKHNYTNSNIKTAFTDNSKCALYSHEQDFQGKMGVEQNARE